MPGDNEKPVTPCKRVCNYAAHLGICLTCRRTKEDLSRWSTMTNEQRLKRMKELEDESLHK
jgi:predicted Fe-S protein YdhL (DUF1289 family)